MNSWILIGRFISAVLNYSVGTYTDRRKEGRKDGQKTPDHINKPKFPIGIWLKNGGRDIINYVNEPKHK